MRERNNEKFKGRQVSLSDLLDIKEWQKIQDNFANITDICMRTLDVDGTPLTIPSKEPRLCREIIKELPIRDRICGPCLPTFLGGRGIVDKNLSFMCEAGLYNLTVPLKVEGSALGYIMLGPVVLVIRKTKEEYQRIAEELNIAIEELWSGILEIKVVSFHGAQALVGLIRDVGEYTLKLSYESTIMRRKEMMLPDSAKINKFLSALLDVAFQITGADIGSIMLVDKDKNELTIQTSRGLADEIVGGVRVKIGDGISGMAAREGASFLIDDNVSDNRIKRYLRRPYLSSSMVVTIKVENNVLGIMNLGALKTSPVRFSTDNVRLVKSLIDLATVALHE